MNIVPVQSNAFSSVLKKRSTQTSKFFFSEYLYSKTRGHTYTWPTRGPPQACLYIKNTTSSTVYMEFSSTIKQQIKTITTNRLAFFVRTPVIDINIATNTVARNFDKTRKNQQLSKIFLFQTKQKLRFHFFLKVSLATICKFLAKSSSPLITW